MTKPCLSQKILRNIEDEIIMMLHASRDCMRNQKKNWKNATFSTHDTYYMEAHGITRGIVLLGHGEHGASNEPMIGENGIINVKRWMFELEQQVLDHEHFNTDNHCDYCLFKYGNDGVRALASMSQDMCLTSTSKMLQRYGKNYDKPDRHRTFAILKKKMRLEKTLGVLSLS